MEIKKQQTNYKITHEDMTIFMEISYQNKMINIYPNSGHKHFYFNNNKSAFKKWRDVLKCMESAIDFAEGELDMNEFVNKVDEEYDHHLNFSHCEKSEIYGAHKISNKTEICDYCGKTLTEINNTNNEKPILSFVDEDGETIFKFKVDEVK